jgi:cytochrome c-type protein NapC
MQQDRPQPVRGIKGLLCRLWAALGRGGSWYGLGLLVVGAVAGVFFWGGFNWALELSNTEPFCISCHEMEATPYQELKKTIHFSNPAGVTAICSDCHVPKQWVYKVIRKIKASRELYFHLTGYVDTPEKFETHRLEMAKRVWATMKSTNSRECRNCHDINSMDFAKQTQRAHTQHQDSLKTGETCIDCHKGIAHKDVSKLEKKAEPTAPESFEIK